MALRPALTLTLTPERAVAVGMPTVKIYHEDGSVEEIPTTTDFARTEQLGRMTQYTATVDRGLADTVSLTPKRDEIELVGLGRGPLTITHRRQFVRRHPDMVASLRSGRVRR